VKTLAWFLTAAAILIGADVFTSSALSPNETAVVESAPSMAGGTGQPEGPPPDVQ
jgi:hypothetical protein